MFSPSPSRFTLKDGWRIWPQFTGTSDFKKPLLSTDKPICCFGKEKKTARRNKNIQLSHHTALEFQCTVFAWTFGNFTILIIHLLIFHSHFNPVQGGGRLDPIPGLHSITIRETNDTSTVCNTAVWIHPSIHLLTSTYPNSGRSLGESEVIRHFSILIMT